MKKLTLLLIGMLFLSLSTEAADWPQWQGPQRDNINPEKNLLPRLPAGGPKKLWEVTECGVGYSGPSIIGDRVYLPGTQGNEEIIHCLDARSGKAIWKKPALVGPQFDNKWGNGPRGSACVEGDFLYQIGGQGNLVCIETATGKTVWSKNLLRDLNGKMMSGWGYSESPLVDGELVFCTPGGPDGTLAALNKKTGAVVWRSKELTDAAAYSSAILGTLGTTKMVIQLTRGGAVGVDVKTGKLLWQQKVVVNNIAIIPTPIYQEGQVYVTSDYGAGCALIQLEGTDSGIQSKVVYENKVMENHHGGVVLLDGHIYGASGNSNGRAKWVCQSLKTGKEVWASGIFEEVGSVTVADGKLFLYGQGTGLIAMVEPTPNGYKELGRFKIPAMTKLNRKQGKIWAHPVVANGKLYVRDLDLLYCYDIAAK